MAFTCCYLDDLGQSLYLLLFAVNFLFEALAARTLYILFFFLKKMFYLHLYGPFFEVGSLIEKIKLLA